MERPSDRGMGTEIRVQDFRPGSGDEAGRFMSARTGVQCVGLKGFGFTVQEFTA